jgi:hypothetical protein
MGQVLTPGTLGGFCHEYILATMQKLTFIVPGKASVARHCGVRSMISHPNLSALCENKSLSWRFLIREKYFANGLVSDMASPTEYTK